MNSATNRNFLFGESRRRRTTWTGLWAFLATSLLAVGAGETNQSRPSLPVVSAQQLQSKRASDGLSATRQQTVGTVLQTNAPRRRTATVHTSGALVKAARADRPLQLLNPLAPSRYGTGEDNLIPGPSEDAPWAVSLFRISWQPPRRTVPPPASEDPTISETVTADPQTRHGWTRILPKTDLSRSRAKARGASASGST